MAKRLYGIRGATGAENTKASIQEQVTALCKQLFAANGIVSEDLVSIQFTMTKDLDALNPCFALRHGDVGIDVSACALFATPELEIAGGAAGLIRVLVTTYLEEKSVLQHVYISGAEKLRPDFAQANKK